MNKKVIKINALILTIILTGFLLVILSFNFSFQKIFKEDISAISEGSSQNIYSQINNLIDIPLNVSITMANDSLLQHFIENELNSNDLDINKVKQYLSKYQKEYNFDSVFLVSTKTNNYYHYKTGLDRHLDKNDDENIWYYTFLSESDNYSLNIDNDQVENDYMTMFVNCKVKDNNGNVIGVVGVGLRTPYIQSFLKQSEKKYDVLTYLIEANGTVVLSKDYTKFDDINIFKNKQFNDMSTAIDISKKSQEDGKWYHNGKIDGYVITKYIPNLNWYLVVEKNTHEFNNTMTNQILITILLSIAVILFVLLIVSFLVIHYNHKIVSISQIDRLTQIKNREAYEHDIKKYIKKASKLKTFSLGIVDLNDLKTINDKFGHLSGDEALVAISQTISLYFTNCFVYRIGGDEFAIIIFNLSKNEIDEIWQKISISLTEFKLTCNITPSAAFGYAFWDSKNLNSVEKLFTAADEAMYKNKQTYK